MSLSAERRPEATVTLLLVLGATLGVLTLGALLKVPCATNNWVDGRQYRRFCYTDLPPLFGTEQLQGNRLPYLDPCLRQPGNCDEYPVLTMYFMRLAASVSDRTAGSFFWTNAAGLAPLAIVTAWMLYWVGGRRALYFSLAPTLLLYAFINWDLLVVVLATAATVAFIRRRDGPAGALLGLGIAAKLYPVLLLVPFVLERLRKGERRAAAAIAAWTAGVWAALNVPFAIVAPGPWSRVFTFNADRPVDYTSVWYVACQRGQEGSPCTLSPHLVDAVSLGGFAALAGLAWWWRRRVDPDFPRWALGFPLIVAFLLTNKVYSAQYSLWLLPWFALAFPNLPLFILFEIADVAVFVTLFQWFGRLTGLSSASTLAGFGGLPLWALKTALVTRALVLVACLVAWARRKEAADVLLPDRELQPSAHAV